MPCLATGTPQRGDDDRGEGRDVVAAGMVAAGADDVDGVLGRLHPCHAAAHGRDGADDLVERFAAHAQRHQEGAALGRRDLAGEQVVEGGSGLLARQRRAGGDLGEIGLEGFHGWLQCTAQGGLCHAPAAFQAAASSKKFRMIVTPCSDRMLSGWNCTPWIGKRAVRQRHDQPVRRLRGDGKIRRAALAVDDQRMIARRAKRPVDARETPSRRDARLPRPCRASAGARARPCRRTPDRWPAGRGRRRRSGSRRPPRGRDQGRCRLRWACRGRATARSRPGATPRSRRRSRRRCARHRPATTSGPMQMHQVPGEAVVVVDDEDAGHGA